MGQEKKMATDEDEKSRKRDGPRSEEEEEEEEEEAVLKLVKRSRERLKDSLNKNKQLLSSTTGHLALTASLITPHVITVNVGEDVVTKIRTLAATSPSLIILSVDGSVSIANIRNDQSDEIKTHEGLFKILSMSCSIESGKETTVNVLLSGPEFKLLSGVARVLLPASPIQIFLGNFNREIGTSSCSRDENGNSLSLLTSSMVPANAHQHQRQAPAPAPAPQAQAHQHKHQRPTPIRPAQSVTHKTTPTPIPAPASHQYQHQEPTNVNTVNEDQGDSSTGSNISII